MLHSPLPCENNWNFALRNSSMSFEPHKSHSSTSKILSENFFSHFLENLNFLWSKRDPLHFSANKYVSKIYKIFCWFHHINECSVCLIHNFCVYKIMNLFLLQRYIQIFSPYFKPKTKIIMWIVKKGKRDIILSTEGKKLEIFFLFRHYILCFHHRIAI